MSCVLLAIPRCLDHNDSPVYLASQYRHATLVLSMHTRSRLMKISRPMTPLRQRMLEDLQASITAPATPFFFCTRQKHLKVKRVCNSMACDIAFSMSS